MLGEGFVGGSGFFRLLDGPVLPIDGLGGKAVDADDTALAEIATTGGGLSVAASGGPASETFATGGGIDADDGDPFLPSGREPKGPDTKNTPTKPSSSANTMSAQIGGRDGFDDATTSICVGAGVGLTR